MAESLTNIVSQQHAQRIKNLLDDTKGTIVLGGETDVENKYIGLTVVRDVQEGDSLLRELSHFPAFIVRIVHLPAFQRDLWTCAVPRPCSGRKRSDRLCK